MAVSSTQRARLYLWDPLWAIATKSGSTCNLLVFSLPQSQAPLWPATLQPVSHCYSRPFVLPLPLRAQQLSSLASITFIWVHTCFTLAPRRPERGERAALRRDAESGILTAPSCVASARILGRQTKFPLCSWAFLGNKQLAREARRQGTALSLSLSRSLEGSPDREAEREGEHTEQ